MATPTKDQRVRVLPPTVVSFEPAILITLRPPAGVTAEQVAADLQALCVALVAHEKALGGDGLAFELTGGRHGNMYWAVTAVRVDGANDRLRQLKELLVQAEQPVEIGGPWRPVAEKYRPDVCVQFKH